MNGCRRVRLLASRGVNIDLDVGANIGQYALRTRNAGYGGRIVSFEPLQSAYAELITRTNTDPEWDCRREALGSSAGEAEIHVDLEKYDGEPLEIGFNPGFITDALKVIDGGEVIVELKAPNKPGVIRTGTEFTYVIMPVNLQ